MTDNTIVQFKYLDSDTKTLSISFEYQNVGYTIKFPPPETDISKGHTKKNHISVFFLFRAYIQECLQGSIEGNNQRAKNKNISNLSSNIWKELPYTFRNEFSKYTNRINEYRTSKKQNPFTSSDVGSSKKVIKQQSYYEKKTYEEIRHAEESTYSESVANDAINDHLKNESSSLEEPIPPANISYHPLIFQDGYEESVYYGIQIFDTGNTELTHYINLMPFLNSYTYDIRYNNFVNSVNRNLYENDLLVYEGTQLNPSFEMDSME
ncbi:11748_t:CDS:2, partial [Dentiscutata erythropus]